MKCDVAIVGGGPGGLAAAIEVVSRGRSCVVLERHSGPVDKACGEGLMPPGLAALRSWDVPIPPAETGRFTAIRWVQEDGRYVEAALPAPGGLGVRRLALHQALGARARAAGADVREGCTVRSLVQHGERAELDTDAGAITARLIVAADGLHSPLRKAAGLEDEPGGPRRFGLRQHFALAPWGERVEVHFAEGLEAYVTPAGARRVGIAFLWEDGQVPGPISFDAMLARFPRLKEQLGSAPADSRAIGAGPLQQNVHAAVRGRLVLLGDAAGYVDAITGEGLTLAFDQAKVLGRLLPAALDEPRELQAYQTASRRAFASYARLASSLVALARRPALRRAALNRLIANPSLFAFALRHLTKPRR
ncbi:MAG: NAD(P)/FAD-dependent oxidoreductase [Myxococcaceae bacterium]|nr:NAD(P)/FAD-dependent oxidoreductase [Myxococcaceae bacterium]